MALKSDNELVAEFKLGEQDAFNELVRRYRQNVYWIARRYLGTHEDADDVVQDVFVKVFRSLKDFRGESAFFTWLYRISINLSINAQRKSKLRTFFRLEDAPPAEAPAEYDPAQQAENSELNQAIEHAIGRLPEKQRAVFILRYHEGLPYEEIAKTLNRSVGGMKANYFHALRKIQNSLRKEFGDDL